MGLNTYPSNPFPPSTDRMDADALEKEVSELNSNLSSLDGEVDLNTQDLTTPSRTKNLIPTTLDILKTANTSGTWSGNAYTAGEVTYTVNTDSDGHVTSIGYSNSSTVSENQLLIIPMPKDGNNYLFNGGISGDCFIFIWDKTANARAKKWDGTTNSDNATSSVFKEVKNVANHDLQMLLRVSSGVTAGSGTLYPMLCKSTETDPTFAPYIPSVESRLDAVESGLDNVQSGLVDLQTITSGIYSLYKERQQTSGNVVFTLKDTGRWVGILIVVGNDSKYAIYGLYCYPNGQLTPSIDKIVGSGAYNIWIDNTTGELTVEIPNWSRAVLLSTRQFE